jgi:glycosyltransferase involved in cell wall biosynthesis
MLNGYGREKLCHVYKNAKAVFCVSQGNLDLLQDQLALKLPQAEVIRNPFNLKWEQENIWPAQEPILKLACVGRLEPDAKGQDLIINSLSRPEWKNRSVEVSFFGEGKSSEGLKQLVENADLSHMIHFHGQVQDIENIWNEHHALLLPSRYEGLPLALIEAMLCGRPAVVTDVAGHTELVTDGIEGIVAVAANQKCWNAAMDKLWNQRSELQRMGLNARTRARMEIPKDPCDEFRKRLLEMIQC